MATQHGKKRLMKNIKHKLTVEGSKRPRTVPVRKTSMRSSSHLFTYSSGKSSKNSKTGRR